VNDFDVIIVGGGIGGLIAGAILARKEGMKVLLLEKEKYLGGKIFSFEKSEFEPGEFHHLLYSLSRSVIVRSDPPIEELLAQKAFKDFIFEGGWHGFIGSDRSRMSFVLKVLEKDLAIAPNRGLRWWADDNWHELRHLMRNWIAEEIKEGRDVSRAMNLMSIEEATAYDHVDLHSYMKSRAKSENVRQFHEVLAGWESGINDPSLISTGEHIKTVTSVHCSGRDFQSGGAGEPKGGFNSMTRVFASIIEESGGTIMTASPVEEIIIRDYEARGIKVKTKEGVKEYLAKYIICNVPLQRVYGLVPQEYWPAEYVDRISRIWPLAGILGWVCTNPPYDPDFAGVYILPVLPGCSASDGFRGDVLFSFEDAGVIDPERVPEGHGLMPVWCGLLPRDPNEIHNKELVNRAIDGMMTFLRTLMPDFDKRVKWYFFTRCDELYSISVSPGIIGDRRLPVVHPIVKNLFFTGDSIEQWSFGINGAAGGAINCASAVSGKDQSLMLPFYMR